MSATIPFRTRLLFAPERGGNALHGGGHPSDETLPEQTYIAEDLGEPVPGRGKKPGDGDPGVPGSRTNPVRPGAEPQPESDEPVGRPTGEGSGAGS